MDEEYDFVAVGAGSAGAVIAARLSEDPSCEVALIEAGDRPPAIESMPAACSALQLDRATDWMYTADAGGAGLGLRDGRMMVPRGKMLGGSSGLNYLAYVRGHPGDFDSWAAQGATGWSYEEVLPLFKKSEGLSPSGDIKVDTEAHSTEGPLGVSVRAPVISGAQEFVDAAAAAGIPTGDYNGRNRGGNTGVASLLQTTTRNGKRSSTYHAFVEGEAEHRPNLTIITRAHAARLILDGDASAQVARGVEYRTENGEIATAMTRKEVVLSAGTVGSPQLLLLSGIGPKDELEATGVRCRLDLPEVGKHLKDHLQVALFFPAPGVGVSVSEVAISMGPDALRAPAGPLPADPADDETLPPELQGLKSEAERRLANPVQPHSEGEVRLASPDPADAPDIRMNYYSDPHDMKVMLAVIRRALDVVAHWPPHRQIGPLLVPPALATKHGYVQDEAPSDALLEDIARHYSLTVYHLCSTCRIGSVVDHELRVKGVAGLRVADASVMPNIVSGNTNAASVMIGERAAELIACSHGVRLAEFVGSPGRDRVAGRSVVEPRTRLESSTEISMTDES